MAQLVSAPVQVDRPELNTVLDAVRERCQQAPDHVAFRVETTDGEQDLTLSDFLASIDAIATGLVRHGVQRGDRVAIMASTSYGWALAEWAIWRAGGVVVPIYESSASDTVADLLRTTGSVLLFADEVARATLANIGLQIVNLEPVDQLVSEFGVTPGLEDLAELDARAASRDEVATIVFTSGSSGEPKGTVILHRNLLDLVLNVQSAWSQVLNQDGRTVIFLPLAHILARGLQAVCLVAGMRVSYIADPKKLVASLPDLQPTFLVVVPRVLEKVVFAAAQAAEASKLGPIWRSAERVAVRWGQACEDADRRGVPMTSLVNRQTRVLHAVYDRLFYRRLRARLGGSMEFMLSGAAPLEARLSLLFRGMGLPVMEGYGLTETTAPITGNRPGRIRSGTVGEPVPGSEVRIGENGEIWVKGVGVASGYLDADQSAEAFRDGWFNTGDLGQLDDGYLTITGRAKDVLVTSGGKTIAPGRWEASLTADPLIAHAVVVGDRRPYLAALLMLDPEGTTADPAADAQGVVTNSTLLSHIDALVSAANQRVARSEQIKKFKVVVADLGVQSGLVTPTQKLRRSAVIQRFEGLIHQMYDSHA